VTEIPKNLFKICKSEPRPETIEYLEDLLARAKTGEIQSFGIVVQKGDAGTANGWTGFGINCMAFVGELEAMKIDYINANVEQRYDCAGEVVDE